MKITFDLEASEIAVFKQALSDYVRNNIQKSVNLRSMDNTLDAENLAMDKRLISSLENATKNALSIDSKLDLAVTLSIESGSVSYNPVREAFHQLFTDDEFKAIENSLHMREVYLHSLLRPVLCLNRSLIQVDLENVRSVLILLGLGIL